MFSLAKTWWHTSRVPSEKIKKKVHRGFPQPLESSHLNLQFGFSWYFCPCSRAGAGSFATGLLAALLDFHFEFLFSYPQAPGSLLLPLISCVFKKNSPCLSSLPLDFVVCSWVYLPLPLPSLPSPTQTSSSSSFSRGSRTIEVPPTPPPAPSAPNPAVATCPPSLISGARDVGVLWLYCSASSCSLPHSLRVARRLLDNFQICKAP